MTLQCHIPWNIPNDKYCQIPIIQISTITYHRNCSKFTHETHETAVIIVIYLYTKCTHSKNCRIIIRGFDRLTEFSTLLLTIPDLKFDDLSQLIFTSVDAVSNLDSAIADCGITLFRWSCLFTSSFELTVTCLHVCVARAVINVSVIHVLSQVGQLQNQVGRTPSVLM